MKPRRIRGRERQGPGAGLAPGKPPLKEAQGRSRQHKGDDPVPMGERKMPPSQNPSPPQALPAAPDGRALRLLPRREFLPDPTGRSAPEPGATRQPRATHLFHAPAQKIRRCNLRSEICNIPEHPARSFSLASRPWIFHAAVSKVSAKDARQDKSVLSFLSLSVSPN